MSPGSGSSENVTSAELARPANADDFELVGMEIPADAGPYREALIEVLSRIPPHWGRWIDCDAGWFHLIQELHEHLVDLDPNYVVHQVKEKYGALRFEAGSSSTDPAVQERFSALLDVAERFSKTVCELCSEPGRLSLSDHADPLYKTMCASCAASLAAAGGRVYRPHVTPPR
jgi:hypothetical protein